MIDDDMQFDNIIYFNFGGDSSVAAGTSGDDEVSPWSGFSHKWLAAYGLPEDGSADKQQWDIINAHIREHLPSVIDWLIAAGIADELAEYAETDEWAPGLAEIVMVTVNNSRTVDGYCDGTVGQASIAVMDWGRLAVAFMEAYDDMR